MPNSSSIRPVSELAVTGKRVFVRVDFNVPPDDSGRITDDARIRVLTASNEMGQGTKTIFPQLVAEELGLDPDDVGIAPQYTSIVPNSGPSVASRTAMVGGGWICMAARRVGMRRV